MKCLLKSFIANLCLEFTMNIKPSKHTFVNYFTVIHSLATVLSVGPWLQQNFHVSELFEIKGCNFAVIASNEPATIPDRQSLISTVNLILIVNATIIECILCAYYSVMCSA